MSVLRSCALALLMVGATALNSEPASSAADPCREYVLAQAAKESAFLLYEQRRDEGASEIANETAMRWRRARETVVASLIDEGNELVKHIFAAWEKARRESGIAVVDTLLLFSLATPQEKAGAEHATVAAALDSVIAAEHTAIILACRIRQRMQP